MKRRVYYLLPDSGHANQLKSELSELAIPGLRVQVFTNNHTGSKGAYHPQSLLANDRDYRLEWLLWRINLAVFFLALLAFIVTWVLFPSTYLVIPGLVMLGTFLAGAIFSLRVPNAHWQEFDHAVSHGEVLVMVDVPVSGLATLDHKIHLRHPEAVTGGVCWTA